MWRRKKVKSIKWRRRLRKEEEKEGVEVQRQTSIWR